MVNHNKEEKTSPGPLNRFYRQPLNELMDTYYKGLAKLEHERSQPVAWISTMVPIEVLNAAGVFPFYPENYSAMCAARGVNDKLIQYAEANGIPRDLCGYATCNIGSVVSGEWAFGQGGVPKPDCLIATRMTCNIHLNWFTYVSRTYQVPLFIMDAPYRTGADYSREDIAYFEEQLKRLIDFLEQTTGKLFSQDRLREVLALSDRASSLWSEISLARKTIPSPLGSKDVFSLMFPMVTLAGLPEAVAFYELIAGEVKRRVAQEIGDAPFEKYRLIWDLFPPWHDLKLWKLFDEAGAVFVIDFYADAFSGSLADPDPFKALANKYLFNPSLQRGIGDKRAMIKQLSSDFHLDGAVFMSNRSCRYFSLGQMGLATYIREHLGLSVFSFEGDHMDPNRYDRENVENKIQAFLEILAQSK